MEKRDKRDTVTKLSIEIRTINRASEKEAIVLIYWSKRTEGDQSKSTSKIGGREERGISIVEVGCALGNDEDAEKRNGLGVL